MAHPNEPVNLNMGASMGATFTIAWVPCMGATFMGATFTIAPLLPSDERRVE